MCNLVTRIENLKNITVGYWGDRIITQLEYSYKLSKINNQIYDEFLIKILCFIEDSVKSIGGFTKHIAEEAELRLSELSTEAKKFNIICVAHAHIDMNWLWRYDETVAITLDTFRTMLNLMNEYPDFKFSQSQASVYKMVEEYNPEMLEEIKQRVKEGRWEITASTWVETDKNMPNGESLSRHILYTKKYLSKLFNINPDSLNLDFEPDTFGHNANVPEILFNGRVKYYYHCRGYEGHNIYRWEAPSGNFILVYREPHWYNALINFSMALYIPEFCTKHGIDTMLKVYGVGDHGGGPSRSDINKIIDMASWPVFPSIRFGTYGEYFNILDKVKSLPTIKGELNFVFTGCYTTQTRIKLANRVLEGKLNEAETFSSIATVNTNFKYRKEPIAEAWKKTLFNQFHDILPGSGIVDTREFAMGNFQQAMATVNIEESLALRKIVDAINTEDLIENKDTSSSLSEGAGVGFGIENFNISQCDRGTGKKRIIHIFNSSQENKKALAEVIIWDFQGDKERIVFKDYCGNTVRHQMIIKDAKYWDHTYMNLLVEANIPAYGYNTYILKEEDMEDVPLSVHLDPRIEKLQEYILENAYIKVVFEGKSLSIVSLIDKTTGEELVNKNALAGIFRLVQEDDSRGMTAWIIGRYKNIKNLNEFVKILDVQINSCILRQSISYDIKFNNSKLKVIVSLDKDSTSINYYVECDWQEIGKEGEGIPQLNFYVPTAYRCKSYKYDIPFGTIDRNDMDIDVPANSWIIGNREETDKNTLMIITASKYGFRGYNNAMAVSLIRSSFDPDPYPENGIHKIKFSVCVVKQGENKRLIQRAYDENHLLIALPGTAHKGTLLNCQNFISVEEGNVIISAIKAPEESSEQKALIVRLHETEGTHTNVKLKFFNEILKSNFVDINENDIDGSINVDKNTLKIKLKPYSLASIYVQFI